MKDQGSKLSGRGHALSQRKPEGKSRDGRGQDDTYALWQSKQHIPPIRLTEDHGDMSCVFLSSLPVWVEAHIPARKDLFQGDNINLTRRRLDST